MAKKRILVLFGGASEDHELSLRSAYYVLNGLSSSEYDVIPVGITKAGRWLYFPGDYNAVRDGTWETDPDCCSAILSPDPLHRGLIKLLEDDSSHSLQRIDVVFPVLHGKYGECGQIQALCKLSGIAYVGSGFSAANACADKMLTHLLLNKAGIKTAKYYYIERVDIDEIVARFDEIEETVNYPMYVKAAVKSRSAGTNIAENREELKSAIKLAFSHHHKIIIEEPLYGRVLECIVWGSVYKLNVSAVAETADNFELIIPAEIDESVINEIENTAKTAFMALGCTSFAKMSFKLTENGLYCCKVSNVPGFGKRGIFAMLMEDGGYPYSEMLDLLIDSAKEA
ncbi:MAG: hypothetical protein FWD34_03830 [Oscillospiraceae bacterium]|nr:hypothetical protein [Oscillospiraceae bacterium]